MRINVVTALTFVLSSLLLSLPARSAQISAILGSPQQYNSQTVTVTGAITGLRQRVSKRGNPYVTFTVCSDACIHIFTFGEPVLHDGERVTVTGIFAAVKQVGRYSFRNEIDAEAVGIRPAEQ